MLGQAKSHSSLQEGTDLLLVLPILVAQKSLFLWLQQWKERTSSKGWKSSTFQAHIQHQQQDGSAHRSGLNQNKNIPCSPVSSYLNEILAWAVGAAWMRMHWAACLFFIWYVFLQSHQEEQDQTSSHFVSTAIYTIKFPLLLPSF